MHEMKEGEGSLTSLTSSEVSCRVTFRFDIVHNVVRRPGFPVAVGRSDNRGFVQTLDGTVLPEGTYQLEADDGEILRVQNAGSNIWVIVSPQAT